MKIGIASSEEIRQRTIDIAAGRIMPKKTDPKIWVTSPQSLTRLKDNLALLELIKLSERSGVNDGMLSLDDAFDRES